MSNANITAHGSKSIKWQSAAMLGAVLALTGCNSTNSTLGEPTIALSSVDVVSTASYAYAPIVDDDISLPAFDYTKMRERYLRRVVSLRTRYKAGTIIVDTTGPFLYLVQRGGKAIRYGIAVGKEGFEWSGDAVVKRKTKWPTWTPPAEMIARSPKLAAYADGMPAGIQNPLGARAMYLFKDGKDTMYRIHGTNYPLSIGKNASSGCFRMINQDVIDLYERVKPGAKVIVRHAPPTYTENR
ncbi:MAG: L,D-transpeptidase [Rhizobiaceae bacterium]